MSSAKVDPTLKTPTKKRQSPVKPLSEPIPEAPHLIGYARVSMVDQSPQLQLDALLKAGVDEANIYQEKVSAAAKRRPQFEAMMKDAREGDIIVIWKLDRLGRSTRQVLDTIAKLDAKGARIRCLTQPIDTSTPWGRMIITVLAAVAEVERDLIRERTIAGLRAARERGRVGGATAKHAHTEILAFAKLGTKPGARKAGMSVPGFIKAKARAAKAMEVQHAKRKRKA